MTLSLTPCDSARLRRSSLTPAGSHRPQSGCTRRAIAAPVPWPRRRARSLEEFGPLLRHAGEEYFLVTSRSVEVHTEFYAPEILHEGDGIYLDSTMGHAYLNTGAKPAKGVCLCTSETPDLYDQLRQIAVREE
jgi:hypothetical protein